MRAGGQSMDTADLKSWRGLGTLALLSVVLTVVTTLIHEFGHLLVPIGYGLPAELHPSSVSGGAIEGSRAPIWMQALQAAGGPILTFVMTVTGLILHRRRPRSLFLTAFVLAAASRLATSVLYLGLRAFVAMLGRPFTGNPNSDELKVAEILGLSPIPVTIAVTVFFAVVIWLTVSRLPRGRRTIGFLVMAASIGATTFAWPALAPDPIATVR